jgi:hypothetical protein
VLLDSAEPPHTATNVKTPSLSAIFLRRIISASSLTNLLIEVIEHA